METRPRAPTEISNNVSASSKRTAIRLGAGNVAHEAESLRTVDRDRTRRGPRCAANR